MAFTRDCQRVLREPTLSPDADQNLNGVASEEGVCRRLLCWSLVDLDGSLEVLRKFDGSFAAPAGSPRVGRPTGDDLLCAAAQTPATFHGAISVPSDSVLRQRTLSPQNTPFATNS